MSLQPRVVVVRRRSEYENLLARHGTHQQADFFLRSRGRSVGELTDRHAALTAAIQTTWAGVPREWRRAEVERDDLTRFLFSPEDVVVVVGQDGLVANVAKYLDGQPVIGIDPEPGRNAGVLVTHTPELAGELMSATVESAVTYQERVMVQATTDDDETLLALNEVYVGQVSHQSARYTLEIGRAETERQSSSGLLVGTGTGATGWLRSVWQERSCQAPLPQPEEDRLSWFVREAWPSPFTGTNRTEGRLEKGATLAVISESDRLVCFGDGMESDMLAVGWGQRLTIGQADQKLRLVAR